MNLIKFAIDNSIIEEYSYYRKPAYRLINEPSQSTLNSKHAKDIIVEEEVEEITIDERLVPQYMNDWDLLDETIARNETIVLLNTPATPLIMTTLPETVPPPSSLSISTPTTPTIMHDPYFVHKRQQDSGAANDDSISRLLAIVEAQQKSISELIQQNQMQQMKQQLQQLSFQKQTERLEILIDKLNLKVDDQPATSSTTTKAFTANTTITNLPPKTASYHKNRNPDKVNQIENSQETKEAGRDLW